MNNNLYVESSNGALKMARKEVYDEVQSFLCFYRETKGFKKYFKREPVEILAMVREKWQTIMNAVNANALYFGQSLYREYLDYVNKLKELLDKVDIGHYPIIKEWRDNYPELAAIHDKVEKMEKDVEDDILFIELFNELRIAANKEFLSKLII